MAGKTDALKERYQKFGEGDLEGALDMWTDDFVWEGPASDDLPGGGRVEGKDESIKKLQEAVGAFDKFELTADEFIEGDDTVVVLGHQDVAKGDKAERLAVVHIWRFKGDDEVCRLQLLTDTLQSGRLLGVV